MEPQDEFTKKRNEVEEELTQVASLIRPLPANVVPSEEFMRRTRLRLLNLDGTAHQSDSEQAAA